jgi:glycosyltransferase involved in cell wall biosynthesis
MIGSQPTTSVMPGRIPAFFVDANPFADRHVTGIGRYTARIALALAARGPVRFFSNGQEVVPPARLDWTPDQDLAYWTRTVWDSPRVPLGPPPPGSIGIYACLRPAERHFPFEVSVLHDFTPLVVPHTHAEMTRQMFQRFFARDLLSSDLALAVSHATKADASWLSPYDQERIVVAHSGPSVCVERHAHPGPVRRHPNAGLVVSTIEPRKNAFFLLDWFSQTRALPDDAELWWVGPVGWMTSRRQLKAYGRLPGRRRIRFLGVVSDAKLCQLYRSVGWSIYASLYEGFGFPVLDALRHGTPVLASGNSSLREFRVPGLFFLDPCDPATVDRAWAQLQQAGSIAIPRDEIDRHYSWSRLTRILLDACAARKAITPEQEPSAAPRSRIAAA